MLPPPASAFDLPAETNPDGTVAHGTAKCWACGTQVTVPLIGESRAPSPIFMCGHCGAITDYMQFPNRSGNTVFRAVMKALTGLRWTVVAFIATLVAFVVISGAVIVLPVTCAELGFWFLALNHFITWFLSFNVYWNYFSAILNTAGSVRECIGDPVEPGQTIPIRCFDNWRYCDKCKWYKPPTAHHCNVCKTCIMDMDHHCPFINNCVGRANLRSFILFLTWTIAANLYCMLHCVYLLLFIRKDAFFAGISGVMNRISGFNIVLITLFTFLEMSWTCLVAIFIFSFSCAMMASVGSLLFLQLKHISSYPPLTPTNDKNGMPIVHSRSLTHLLAHLHQIMGGGSISNYFYPMWGPPPGCLAKDKKKL